MKKAATEYVAKFRVFLFLPVFAISFCQPAFAQVRIMQSAIEVEHSEYSDLNYRVNMTADQVFGSPEGRKTGAAQLLSALDRLVPLVQEDMKHPGSETKLPGYAQFLSENPAAAQGLRMLHAQRIKLFNLFRLALDETNAVQTYQAALAKSGPAAAQAALDRAVADWLVAGQDSLAQLAAFEKLRDANNAAAPKLPWQIWSDLLQFNQLSSVAVGSPMLAYVKPYFYNIEAVRMLHHWTIPVKRMQLDGTPLTIDGTLVSGSHFSTAAWKGRVILIDGWAPCLPESVANLPQVQGILAAHHAEGLEVLGITYGQTASAEKVFMSRHPEITFLQLSDPSHPDIAKICSGTTTFGLNGETMGPPRVIDRNGIVHYLLDRENMEAEVVKLLAETPSNSAEVTDAR